MNIRRVHPGVLIKENLDVMQMTAREFAYRTGISERTLSSIINGNGDITFDVAYKLSSFFDDSIEFWINSQTQYDMYILEQEKEKEIIEEYHLVKNIKNYLQEFEYISSEDKKEIVYKCRELVGVNNLLLLYRKDSFVCLKEQHSEKENESFYQNFWIALALKEARKKNGIPFNKKLLLDSIQEIRSMTVKAPKLFYPRLEEIFAKCGISFVLLPYLSESKIYGATKWFNKDKVMLAVSTIDNSNLFWNSLFHEIAHVLMMRRRELLIHIDGNEDEENSKIITKLMNYKK